MNVVVMGVRHMARKYSRGAKPCYHSRAMKLLLAALAVTFTIAVTASVFAIWPVVADAPWEDDTPVVVDTDIDALRCESALGLRADILADGREAYGDGVRDPEGWHVVYERQLSQAESEIQHNC